MSETGIDYRPDEEIRKTVETKFSELQNFRLEHLTLHQMPSIMAKSHLTVLLYNLFEGEAHKAQPNTLKWPMRLKVLMK